jgi:hypothetical protein
MNLNNTGYISIEPYAGCGIGGTIWQVLRAIYHNPGKRFYVNLTKECVYKDFAITHTNNPWEYYFEQPSNITADMVVEDTVGLVNDYESEYRDVFMKNPSEEYNKSRYTFNKLINEYIKPLPHINNKINNFIEQNFNGRNILGVHLRGTDHPDKLLPHKYLAAIKEKINNYDKLFVCSDEQERVDICVREFGDKVITHDSIRSDSPQCLHHRENTYNYHYKIGEDVIIEAYLLSKVNFLLCCSNSNINYFSRAINPELPSIAVV